MSNINIIIAKSIFSLRPNHPISYKMLAKAFAKQKRYDTALEHWTEARNRFPKHAEIIKGRIRALRALGRFDETITEAERLIALEPGELAGYEYLAKAFMARERFDTALECWTEARDRFPDNSDIIHGQVRALQELGRHDNARTEAERLVALDPELPIGYVCIAAGLMSQKRYDAALEQWNQAGKLFPDYDRIDQGKIRALRSLGRFDEALREADRLISLKPTELIGYIERFDVLYAASHYREAYRFMLETLKRHKPSVVAVNKFLSAAIAVKGRKFARRFCYHMLCTQPRGPVLLIRYLFLCAETGNVEGIDSAVSAFPNHRGLVNDKINLLKAMAHSNNLDMYQSLDFFRRQPMDKHSIFSISQAIVMSAILGDRAYARKGLIGLYKYDDVYGGNRHEKIHSNVKMHLRYNIIDDKIETLMVQLNSLMKEKKYDRVFRLSGEYLDQFKMETSLSCVYLIAAIKSGSYKFQAAGAGPAHRMMFFWDNPEIPEQISSLITLNKKNNPDVECEIYDDKSAREFLKKHYNSFILKAYDNAIHPSQKGDIFRLAYLYDKGGFYIDVDDVILGNLNKHFEGASSAFFVESIGHVGNNFLATVAGNGFFRDMLIEASENVLSRKFDKCIWRSTGPGLVSRHVAREVNDIIRNGRARSLKISLPREHKNMSTYHLPLNYKNAGLHWMGEGELE